MTVERKKCKNCEQDFQILPEDVVFYEKTHVPPPTWCPQCREMRRWSFRNERTLYPRTCDKCKKQIISIWSQDKPQAVYCRECFNSDDFDPTAYGRGLDFSRPFFDQFKDLLNSVPVVALLGGANCVNSDYVNLETDDKNCYMNVGGHWNEDCYYNTFSLHGKNNVDNYWVIHCEYMYESIDCHSSYRCFYSRNCVSCTECWFCYDCRNCTNCFGCTNQRNKQYMFFDTQYSKEEYEKQITELARDTQQIARARERFEGEKLSRPHRFAFIEKSEHCTGNYITKSKDALESFDSEEGENIRYSQIVGYVKDSMDCSAVGVSELVYESVGVGMPCSRSAFCGLSFPAIQECYYCLMCRNIDYSFGCISLKKNQYCILNKQYSREEYDSLVPRIVEHMKQTGEWGEFFPPQISPFGYNETVAQIYFPLTREQALAKGYSWQDVLPASAGKETIVEIPRSIDDVPADFSKEILACVKCRKNYKIINQELDFYKSMHLPLPRWCSTCRHENRLKLRGISRTLHHRQCMCERAEHDHTGRCAAEFETTYSPERPEVVYCEQCYQGEVV